MLGAFAGANASFIGTTFVGAGGSIGAAIFVDVGSGGAKVLLD